MKGRSIYFTRDEILFLKRCVGHVDPQDFLDTEHGHIDPDYESFNLYAKVNEKLFNALTRTEADGMTHEYLEHLGADKGKPYILYRCLKGEKPIEFYRFYHDEVESIRDTDEGCKLSFKNGDWFEMEMTAAEFKGLIGWEVAE